MSEDRPCGPKTICVSWRRAARLNSTAPARPTCCGGPTRISAVSNGPRGWATCNYVVASNMQDAVLVDLAAKVRPGVPVLFLDTGYHFVETIGTRDAIESVYDIRVLNVTPEHTVAEQDELLGKDLFARDPGECCRMRKVSPAGQSAARLLGLGDRAAPGRGAHPRQRPADQLRRGVQAGEDQPACSVDRRGDAGLHRPSTMFWSIPLSTKAIRRSAALRARPSPSKAPTRAADAGRGRPRPNAGCTLRDRARPDRARKCGSAVGGQRAGRRGPAGEACGRAWTFGWLSWNTIRRISLTCFTVCRRTTTRW